MTAVRRAGPTTRAAAAAAAGLVALAFVSAAWWRPQRALLAPGGGASGASAVLLAGSRALPVHKKLNYAPVPGDPTSALGELRQRGVYLVMAGVHAASFWHSPPQLALDGDAAAARDRLATFVCEIPAGTVAKHEIHKGERRTPIVQDVKAGRLREYPMPLGVSYGALPQTYESAAASTPDAFTGLVGDGDPIDALDMSSVPAAAAAVGGVRLPATGDVYPVRVIGALAMNDGGEADWKIFTVRTDDPLLGAVTDVRQLLPHQRVVPHDELVALSPLVATPLVAAFRRDAGVLRGGGAPGVGAPALEPAAAELPPAAVHAGRARLDAAVAFFSAYKKADPRDDAEPSPVSFAFRGRFLDAQAAMAVIAQGYQHWCRLAQGAMRRAQREPDTAALARARELVVRCESALRRKRLGIEDGADALPPSRDVWV